MKGNDLVLSQELQCKNCKQPLGNHDKFCSDCAAKVISERITFKNLIGDLIKDNLGIDNKYFYTVASMITKPSRVLEEYLGGTRKKYVHALTFLVIGMTLAIFAFNVFDEEYMAMNDAFQKSQFEWYGENLGGPFANPEYQEKEMARSSQMQRYMLKYFNIMVVILLPIYSFITYFVYGKPYNYGEHIVINSYIQGNTFLSLSILFLLSLVTHPLVYVANTFLAIVFYTYVFGKLYKLSFGQSIFKLFLFFAILAGLVIFLGIAAFFLGLLIKVLG